MHFSPITLYNLLSSSRPPIPTALLLPALSLLILLVYHSPLTNTFHHPPLFRHPAIILIALFHTHIRPFLPFFTHIGPPPFTLSLYHTSLSHILPHSRTEPSTPVSTFTSSYIFCPFYFCYLRVPQSPPVPQTKLLPFCSLLTHHDMPPGQPNIHLNRASHTTALSHHNSTPFSMHIPPPMSSIPMPIHHHHQYPGINSIPGMHSINHINTLQHPSTTTTTTTTHHPLHPVSTVQSFPAISSVPTMQSLLHPPPHTSNHTIASSSRKLVGAVDKPRKSRHLHHHHHHPHKAENISYASILSAEDPTSMIIAAQNATQSATNALIHPDPHPVLPPLPSTSPIYEADGIQFKVLHQLPDTKIQRLRTEKIKPIELLTFADIKAYNRNQLRAYCAVYGIRRKKKAEMERDMARYSALFHPNDPSYDWNKFEPAEYADGPIPRRKVPVTKEEKEKAAGDFKRLTSALQQKNASTGYSTLRSPHPYPSIPDSHHQQQFQQQRVQHQQHHHQNHHSLHHLQQQHGFMSHPSQPLHNNYSQHQQPHTSGIASSRMQDILGHTSTHVYSQHGGMGHHATHPTEEHEGSVMVSASELMSVPEMHISNHLLSVSNPIEE